MWKSRCSGYLRRNSYLQKKVENDNKQLFQHQGKKNFTKFFDKSVIDRKGRSSGFIQRKAQKITAYYFVIGFILSCLKKQNTYKQWATQIELLSGKSVSRQAVFDRIGKSAVEFCRQLLEHAIKRSVVVEERASALFHCFGKVLLHDSTTLKLPQSLSEAFPGNHSRGEQKAVARIQSIINIKEMNFEQLSLGSFTQNDQSASSEILPYCSKGDLVIRDLGYYALSAFAAMIDKGVHFVSRLKYGVKLYDLKGNEIVLGSLLKGKRRLDRWVYIGAGKKVKVRLVMIPLPAGQTAEKRRKARQDRDRRVNHSKAYYQWLGYTVLITTVEQSIWSYRDVARAYKVRWHIEIIFKSWKSGFHLQALLHERCGNEDRAKTCIYLLLLFICLFMQKIYLPYQQSIEKQFGKTISLLTLAHFVAANVLDMFLVSRMRLKELIAKHCCYDIRHDRTNMTDLFFNKN